MKCYKVVYELNKGEYFSVATSCDWMLTYQIGKWIEPKIGKIFVFNNKKNAIRFAKYIGGKRVKIVKAECENLEKMSERSAIVEKNYVRRFWEGDDSVPTAPPVPGMRLTNKVKLIEEIEY